MAFHIMEVWDELKKAKAKFPKKLNSAHEAYGVLLEEVDEFWEEVKKNSQTRDKKNMRQELLQIAAMACATIIDLDL